MTIPNYRTKYSKSSPDSFTKTVALPAIIYPAPDFNVPYYVNGLKVLLFQFGMIRTITFTFNWFIHPLTEDHLRSFSTMNTF